MNSNLTTSPRLGSLLALLGIAAPLSALPGHPVATPTPFAGHQVLLERAVDLDANGLQESLTVVRTPLGRTELILSDGVERSRIGGFRFGREDVLQLTLTDANLDGIQDIVVSNFESRPTGPALSPGWTNEGGFEAFESGFVPSVYTLITPPEGFGPRLWVDSVRPGGRGVDQLTFRFSFVSDRDNFGFGVGTGAPPCNYFDNSGAPDLGVFDRELTSGDETDTWSHAFRPVGFQLAVALITWEIFSDPTPQSTISMDGMVMNYATANHAICGAYPESGVRRIHVVSGSGAAIAADGNVDVVFQENGDDISMDASLLLAISWSFVVPSND